VPAERYVPLISTTRSLPRSASSIPPFAAEDGWGEDSAGDETMQVEILMDCPA